jgi:GNAT superfamily N-acetyltransferase
MFADTALARRIEHGEALNAARCGEWLAVAGGYAAFSGVGSPLTHAIGLGLNGPVLAADFDHMEHFYRSRGSVINLDFCPHADPTMLDLLGLRGYRIVECNHVLAGPVAGSPDARVRIARRDEQKLWSRLMLEGFFDRTEFTALELEVGARLFQLEGASAWFGIVNGEPVAAGAMNVRNQLALLFADSTLKNFRGQGLHLALIRARLQHAAGLGCDLATASTAPGSVSQRNYERAGLRVIYTKLNMQKD